MSEGTKQMTKQIQTQDCAGWKNIGYNWKLLAIQSILILIGSLITAWVFTVI